MFGANLIDMLIPAEEKAAMTNHAAALFARMSRAEQAIYRTEHKIDVILRAVLKMAEKAGVEMTDDVSLITDATVISEGQNAKPV